MARRLYLISPLIFATSEVYSLKRNLISDLSHVPERVDESRQRFYIVVKLCSWFRLAISSISILHVGVNRKPKELA